MFKAPQAHQENQDEGVGLAVMVHEGCQGRPGQRVTEGLMALRDCPGRKGTGVNQALQGPQELPETMEKEVTMEKLDPEDSLGNLDLVVCWVQKAPQDPQDLQV